MLLRELYNFELENGLCNRGFSIESLSTVLGGFSLDLSDTISVGAVGITIWWTWEDIVIGSLFLVAS